MITIYNFEELKGRWISPEYRVNDMVLYEGYYIIYVGPTHTNLFKVAINRNVVDKNLRFIVYDNDNNELNDTYYHKNRINTLDGMRDTLKHLLV